MKILRLGFVLNPIAGAGGPAALKGSDAETTRAAVYSGELISPAVDRALLFFAALKNHQDCLKIVCAAGIMGSTVLDQVEYGHELISYQPKKTSDSEDTKAVCKALLDYGVDILVFAGGDGTARDVCEVVRDKQLCLGIPSGVKMQSAVFGIHPQASAEVVTAIIKGEKVSVETREVRDIDEAALQEGVVKSRYFGDIKLPLIDNLIQGVKQGSGELDATLILDIADELRDRFGEHECLLIFGPGSTTNAVQKELGLDGSLLGVDVYFGNEKRLDVNEEILFSVLSQIRHLKIHLVLTIIGGQGHIIGRGNQQLSARVLALIGKENVSAISAPNKLQLLQGRPLNIDSGDNKLNEQWRGLIEVITGYKKVNLYRLG